MHVMDVTLEVMIATLVMIATFLRLCYQNAEVGFLGFGMFG